MQFVCVFVCVGEREGEREGFFFSTITAICDAAFTVTVYNTHQGFPTPGLGAGAGS